ncbi:MAG: hypothetical protein SFU25_02140, partial [Candidatus Caenarcaniphilales bacterium]|nr:hypothetical protein [Candidatus Caenarcaniphilales bacterium]
MASKHLNITLPEELIEELNSSIGNREKSAFIAESVKEGLLKRKKQKLREELEESYKALAEEDRELNKEWEVVDLEGWD